MLVNGRVARQVSLPAEPPFGVGRPNRHAHVVSLTPGDSLVLITDGLVERRGEDIDNGIRRVLDKATASAATRADELLEHLLATNGAPDNEDDDVTMLVLRRA